MAELLVRVVDKVNDDFYLNCKCTKRGDVIVAQPDGWLWGKEELANPDWRIFKLPDMKLADAQAMLAPELDVDPQHPSKTLQRRVFKFNLDDPSLPVATQTLVTDATRQSEAVAGVSAPALLALKVQKAPVADPAVIGIPPTVIG